MDQRAIVVLGASIVCGLLTFVSDNLAWVPLVLSIAYAIFALLSWLDWMSRRRG